jgi:hypothetical protein
LIINLNSDAPSGSTVNVSLSVNDPKTEFSAAWASLSLNYLK